MTFKNSDGTHRISKKVTKGQHLHLTLQDCEHLMYDLGPVSDISFNKLWVDWAKDETQRFPELVQPKYVLCPSSVELWYSDSPWQQVIKEQSLHFNPVVLEIAYKYRP